MSARYHMIIEVDVIDESHVYVLGEHYCDGGPIGRRSAMLYAREAMAARGRPVVVIDANFSRGGGRWLVTAKTMTDIGVVDVG